jgi:coproporphyrinogen III oxidase-like Fe-S oxidoreductase
MFPGTGLYRRILDERRPAPRYGEHLVRLRRATARTLTARGFRGVTGDAYLRGADEVCVPTALGGGGNGLNTILGLGPSSWGLIQGTAYRNVPDLDRYHQMLGAERFPVDRAMRLDEQIARLRAQILGIALLGVPTALVRESQGERSFRRWQGFGLIRETGDHWRVTDEGRLWCNQMQLELLPMLDRLKLVRMLGSPRDQETFFQRDGGGLAAIGDEISRFVKAPGGAVGEAQWLGYRGYLKLLKAPIFDSRAVGWNGVTD